tara:strand:- start:162 stop:410 length:249 start_codon:yes stop_codon:yes gene_type:complete
MKWLWGEKKHKQERTSMNYNTERDTTAIIRTTVKVHHTLDIEYPAKDNIAQVLRDVEVDMKLPPGVEIHDADITHVEVLGDK